MQQAHASDDGYHDAAKVREVLGAIGSELLKR